jgi:hypothetical protein
VKFDDLGTTQESSCGSDEVPNQIYQSENVSESEIEKEIESLINLCHPCILPPVGFIFPSESGSREELKIIRMYLEGCSLSEIFSVNPIWWIWERA